MMNQSIGIQLLTAALFTLGFSVLFYVHPRRIPLATLGGCLTCGVYLLMAYLIGGELLPNFIAAAVGGIYAEVLARVTRAPATVYLLPALIPLVPGSKLYYTMFHLVGGEYQTAARYGWVALQIALGIAGGIAISAVIGLFLRRKAKRPTA